MARTKTAVVEAGTVFHFLRSGFTYRETINSTSGVISERGQTVTVTDDMLEASRDKNGATWLDLLYDPDAQIGRYRHVYFKPGPAPEDMEFWESGTIEAELEYQRRRTQIYASLVDEDEIAVALAKLNNSKLGRGRPKKLSHGVYEFNDDTPERAY